MIRPLYFVNEALVSLRRNLVMSIAATTTVAISLLVLGSFVTMSLMLGNVLDQTEREVGLVKVFLKDAAAQEQVKSLQDKTVTMKDVDAVDYVSKEQALERLKAKMKGHPEIFQEMQGNPLPASLEIRVKHPEAAKTVAGALRGDAAIDEIKYSSQLIDRLVASTSIIRWLGYLFIGLLTFASLVLIANTIRLAIHSRRREVAIMRLVGASNWFIRWPFLLEGIFQGVVGALIAVILLSVANEAIFDRIRSILSFLPLTASQNFFFNLVAALALAGIAVGSLGSLLALRRYLKV